MGCPSPSNGGQLTALSLGHGSRKNRSADPDYFAALGLIPPSPTPLISRPGHATHRWIASGSYDFDIWIDPCGATLYRVLRADDDAEGAVPHEGIPRCESPDLGCLGVGFHSQRCVLGARWIGECAPGAARSDRALWSSLLCVPLHHHSTSQSRCVLAAGEGCSMSSREVVQRSAASARWDRAGRTVVEWWRRGEQTKPIRYWDELVEMGLVRSCIFAGLLLHAIPPTGFRSTGLGLRPRVNGAKPSISRGRERHHFLFAHNGLLFWSLGSSSITSNQNIYGPVGTVTVLLEVLVGLGVAIHLGALMGPWIGRSGARRPLGTS